MTVDSVIRFNDLLLPNELLKVLKEVGYESPSPIQAKTIPLMLAGGDVVGQAQTGTGKTAAFALPMLSKLDLKLKLPQGIVLVPTRELAIQVAEAFQKYAKYVKGFHVLPIYGGHDYRSQIRSLSRGVHIVVGTPGRMMDHIRRGNLKLESTSIFVLDEADEMLRMGFIGDVEWILEHIPLNRQTALFSATMPAQIRRIATRYLREPTEITIKSKTYTVETIRQRYWLVSGIHKLDALTRLLDTESFDAMLIFVRTKIMTSELVEKLLARGYKSAALNGDISQSQREQVISRVKASKLDVIVATDVAARGLDVERISHVINYDIPYDAETYVHRIGRTGRAGRQGDAILFVAPREKHLLRTIEKTIGHKIEIMELPSLEVANDLRLEKFKQRITELLATENYQHLYPLIEEYQQEHDVTALDIASALAQLLYGNSQKLSKLASPVRGSAQFKPEIDSSPGERLSSRPAEQQLPPEDRNKPLAESMERYRIAVGRKHGVKPANIVGAIANEAGIDSRYIGGIQIFEDHSIVDLPEGMPKEIFNHLQNVRVMGKPLRIFRLSQEADSSLPLLMSLHHHNATQQPKPVKVKPGKSKSIKLKSGQTKSVKPRDTKSKTRTKSRAKKNIIGGKNQNKR